VGVLFPHPAAHVVRGDPPHRKRGRGILPRYRRAGSFARLPLLRVASGDNHDEQRQSVFRQLVEQAAAFSGAEDEDRNADRIAQQQEELDKLLKQRDALLRK
jgi:hypothetical protein